MFIKLVSLELFLTRDRVKTMTSRFDLVRHIVVGVPEQGRAWSEPSVARKMGEGGADNSKRTVMCNATWVGVDYSFVCLVH